jgi:hypothetical protein
MDTWNFAHGCTWKVIEIQKLEMLSLSYRNYLDFESLRYEPFSWILGNYLEFEYSSFEPFSWRLGIYLLNA